jgi:hypothetical protein
LIDDALVTPLPYVEACVWKLFQLSPATGNAPKSAEPLTALKLESPGFADESLGPAKLMDIDFDTHPSAKADVAAVTQIAAIAARIIFVSILLAFPSLVED